MTLPPNGGGITYTMSPAAPVAGNQVTVTATLSDGYAWVDPLPDGWLAGDPAATKATWSETLEYAPCTPVTPLYPVATEATCTAGEVTVPTVVLPRVRRGSLTPLFRRVRMTPGTDDYRWW